MDCVIYQGTTLILFGRSAIQPACLFDMYLFCTPSFNGLKSPVLKKCFCDLNVYEAVKSSGLVVQLKLKCLLMKPTHDDIIEAKEVNIQLSFERYKGKLVCLFKIRQYIKFQRVL